MQLPAMEIGHATTAEDSAASEANWELRWPACIRPYARMAREDSQVKSVLKAVTLPIRRTTWRLDPNGADAERVRLVAEDLRLPVLGESGNSPAAQTGGHASWDKHLPWALKSLVFGHAFFEVVFREVDGRDRLHKLAYRPPETIAKIRVARDGGLLGIVQEPAPGDRSTNIEIPVGHLLAYLHEPDDTSWTGESALRAAYKHWVLKDRFMRLEDQILDRNGMGVPTYVASENDPAEIKRGQDITRRVRAGAATGVSVPREAKFDLKGVSGQIVSPREAIVYQDSQIARTLLAHFLNLEGKGGSYSLAEVQAETFTQSLQTIAEDIANTANQYLVEPLVNLAFDTESGPYPRIVFDPIGSKKELGAEALAQLANAKVILPDRDLEEEVRRRYSLPAKRTAPPVPSADQMQKLANAAKALIDAGMDPAEARRVVGLPEEEVTPGAPQQP